MQKLKWLKDMRNLIIAPDVEEACESMLKDPKTRPAFLMGGAAGFMSGIILSALVMAAIFAGTWE